MSFNPTKAVIGGISQSANVVKGGVTQRNGLNDVGGELTNVPGISQGVSILVDYRKFLDRGNVIDLAVAVVIGKTLHIAYTEDPQMSYPWAQPFAFDATNFAALSCYP
ncbi:hypothetical protein BGZ54_004234 [Gamsiella multidivaricata]|nr:hypothetical protein BGZ54_004234 [Gamsiella multidivaricata]